MTKKNIKMNELFWNCTKEQQMKGLEITEEIMQSSRFKNMTIENIIQQLWNGRYNSEKRQILKRALN